MRHNFLRKVNLLVIIRLGKSGHRPLFFCAVLRIFGFMKYLSAFFILSILLACGTSKLVPTLEQEYEQASKVDPDLSLEQFKEGKELYTSYCQKCHGLKAHDVLDAEGWKKIVPPMVGKVNKNEALINTEQQATLLRYLVSMAPR